MNRIIAATAFAIAFWGLKRWFDRRYVRIGRTRDNPTETWENEGGALSRRTSRVDPSRVPLS